MIRCERHDCPASDCRVVAQFHQLKLPIGDIGKLADRLADRRVDQAKPLAGAPAVPDIAAQQVGTRHHRGVAFGAFADLLLDDHGFADRGDVAQVGRLKRRRRRRPIELRRGVLEERDHVGKALVGRAAQWKADAALWIVLRRIHQRSPMLDRALDEDSEQGGAPLRLPSGDLAKPDPNRRPHTQARFKVFRQPILEKYTERRTPDRRACGRCGHHCGLHCGLHRGLHASPFARFRKPETPFFKGFSR